MTMSCTFSRLLDKESKNQTQNSQIYDMLYLLGFSVFPGNGVTCIETKRYTVDSKEIQNFRLQVREITGDVSFRGWLITGVRPSACGGTSDVT